MIRICFFSGNMSLGGGTQHMTQLLANQLCQDDSFQIFILGKSGKDGKSFYPLDAKITFDILDKNKYSKFISPVKNIIQLLLYLCRHRIDILVIVDVTLGFFSIPLKLFSPSLKQIYWDHFYVGFNYGYLEKFRKWALRFGDAYITLTPEDANELKKKYVPKIHLQAIPNILPYHTSPLPYDLKSKEIITAGNFLREKGIDLAVECAEIVFRRHPDWHWNLYGDGPLYEKIRCSISNKHLEMNMRLHGRVFDMRPALAQSSIYVLPSRTEGFGLVIAEAKAYKLPVVAFDVPYGPRNLVKNEINGYLIKALDVVSMADAICHLIEDSELRVSFSKKAVIDLEPLTAEKVAAQWKQVFALLS